MKPVHRSLFGAVMFWTILTTVFTLLPLARIIGRAEGYEWQVLGLSGSGFAGPFLVFVPALAYAVALLYAAHRAPRRVFHPMLIIWHLTVTAIVLTVGFSSEGSTIEGQGLHWQVSGVVAAIPCVAFTLLVFIWVVLDRRQGGERTGARWTRTNTRRLLTALVILLAAIALFRAGDNYNWVTAVAIIATIGHWILLARSFEPTTESSA